MGLGSLAIAYNTLPLLILTIKLLLIVPQPIYNCRVEISKYMEEKICARQTNLLIMPICQLFIKNVYELNIQIFGFTVQSTE